MATICSEQCFKAPLRTYKRNDVHVHLKLLLLAAYSIQSSHSFILRSSTFKVRNSKLKHFHNGDFQSSQQRHICTALSSSIPPPRFDVFSECILGKWKGESTSTTRIETSQTDSSTTYEVEGEVEEVMRSCGGSVQGVREISTEEDDHADLNRPYHNRANDGFIYFDCGSYSSGPVQLTGSIGEETIMSASITLPPEDSEALRRRFYVKVHLNDVFSLEKVTSTSLQKKKLVTDSQLCEGERNLGTESSSSIETDINIIPLGSISWYKEDLCSMPQLNQPWMLQRVKWQRAHNQNTRHYHDNGKIMGIERFDDDKSAESEGLQCLKGWIFIANTQNWQESEAKFERLHNCSEFNDFLPTDYALLNPGDKRLVIQIGAVCPRTKEVRAVIRNYNQSGALQSILFQEGLLQK